MNRTLAIIKPDVVEKKKIGEVISMLEKHFEIVEMKMIRLSRERAIEFYKEHNGKEFFDRLIDFMTSGPVVVLVVEGENAVKRLREVVGDTDPKKSKLGTIRNLYGEELPRNAMHASDSEESAIREINFFFPSK